MKTTFAIVYTLWDLNLAIAACPRGQIIVFDDGKEIRIIDPCPF